MITETDLKARARRAGVVPVLTLDDAEAAVPLARALAAGGLDVMEVTLRTEAALEAIAAIAGSDVDCVIGAGTILSEGDTDAAAKAGAQFLVTPGTPASLVPALLDYPGPVIPGSSTASEAMTLGEAGFGLLKFFPAEPAGGTDFLKALAGPLPEISFMPTGGIRPDRLVSYLSLPNVVAVGGSWIAAEKDIAKRNWRDIEARAKDAFDTATAAMPSPH
ncbi:MAG: bifunctional 4-hydroxy-2-oxoglutarate aldolase/2-dehydro-3-deoxy-phosphogluconate aldolase [Alphaproteobacteria bacterium]|jgi:2-dehydro-3-deoxyphosphogluconate aldolase/(4S)-4-hydroxy-2-oxoglutarate aldolase|nr:bifunctional 4-hydroxy-2-oxoglutarate aldolase/2-dehydro-3-deoxy-phosphogluconate aldolase [Alphaproteobacteria bacterium]